MRESMVEDRAHTWRPGPTGEPTHLPQRMGPGGATAKGACCPTARPHGRSLNSAAHVCWSQDGFQVGGRFTR